MHRIRSVAGLIVLGLVLVTVLVLGLKAQPASTNPSDAAVNRRIEVMVRAQFNVPQDYQVAIGARKPSNIPGYDTLPITLTRGARSSHFDFLISTDGNTLARLETFDLSKSPVFNIKTDGRPVRGNPDARVTVINFDDLECPFCARMHQSLFPDTLERYKDKVRFVYKDFPLTESHPWAMHAAVDANCLGAQSTPVYWTYVDYLHNHGQEVNGDARDNQKSFAALDRIARQEATLGKLDQTRVDACIAKQDESQVRASMAEGEALGVDGTPAVFIDGERVSGAVPEEQLWMVIDRALRARGEEPPPPPRPATAPATPASAQPQGAKGSGR